MLSILNSGCNTTKCGTSESVCELYKAAVYHKSHMIISDGHKWLIIDLFFWCEDVNIGSSNGSVGS